MFECHNPVYQPSGSNQASTSEFESSPGGKVPSEQAARSSVPIGEADVR